MADGRYVRPGETRNTGALRSHTVLVAEDEQDMLDLIARRIDRMGHRVLKAHDGKEAVDLLLRSQIDLVVTDINMPGFSGLEVLSESKTRDPYVQVIIVTANATMDNAIEALNRGAFSYLTKPFDHISVISSAVERALEFRQLTIDNIRMAEAQRRRGDMLEDEVADRLRQLGRQDHAYRELLANLPIGIIVASSNGMYQAKNPAGERWLARDETTRDRKLARFLKSLQSDQGRRSRLMVEIAGRQLRLRAMLLNRHGENAEWLVVVEDMSDGARMVAERVAPHVSGLASLLSPRLFSETTQFHRMARGVGGIERICLELGINPHDPSTTNPRPPDLGGSSKSPL